jgi:endonuclease YncB( thermonuclease family)
MGVLPHYLVARPQQDQEDYGIDYEIEVMLPEGRRLIARNGLRRADRMRILRALPVVLALAAVILFAGAKPHYTLTGKVVAISDGDTLTVLDDSKTQHKIRLAGIDAPEKAQAFGNRAREALGDKVFQQSVRVEVIDIDRYKREVGRIYLGDRFINMEMVHDGLAWRYVQYDEPGEFTAAETDAREHHRGLWADPHPMPPWEWRKAKRQSSKSQRSALP